ncbi:MAG: DUF4282 domain-containing protein [Planctomycetota bacterium]|nr:DUF4282 domain-containing protein [Planctomycetota bacterium]
MTETPATTPAAATTTTAATTPKSGPDFAAIFDFGIKKFFAPNGLKIAYALGLVAIVLIALVNWAAFIFGEFQQQKLYITFLRFAIATPVILILATIAIVLFRVAIEVAAAVFQIHANVVKPVEPPAATAGEPGAV